MFKANVVFPILGREAITISLEEGGEKKAVSYFQVYILAFFCHVIYPFIKDKWIGFRVQ